MNKKDIKPDTFSNQKKPHPLLKDLSDFVKDPANYESIQRELLDTLATTHSHNDVETWSTCFDCQQKVKDHKKLMLKLGFKGSATYMAWKKVHEAIKTRSPLIAWNQSK